MHSNKTLIYILQWVSILVTLFGLFINSPFTILVACYFILVCNIFLSFFNWKKNVVFLLFNLTFALFLLSKPLASLFINRDYWNIFSIDNSIKALLMCFLSLVSMSFVALKLCDKKNISKNVENSKNLSLQNASFFVFIVSFLSSIYEMIGSIKYFSTHSYLDYYTGGYTTDYVPIVLRILMQFMLPALCIFLSTKPNKKKCNFILLLYFMSQLPSFLLGKRAPIILTACFIFSYLVIRDNENLNMVKINEEKYKITKWVSAKKLRLILLAIPFLIFYLTIYNEIRNGIVSSQLISKKLAHPLAYFAYEQGGTLDLLQNFFDIRSQLPAKFYFLGPLYDTFFHNSLLATLFGINVYTGTTMEYLNSTHTLAAQLSYYILGNSYFDGNSVDSSYLLDIFVNFSWLGIIVVSVLLAIYMLNIFKYMNGNWLVRTIILASLTNIFLMPRAMFMSTFSFIVSPYFWFGILFCYLIALGVSSKKG